MKVTAVALGFLFLASTGFAQQFSVTTPGGALASCPAPSAPNNILCSVVSSPPAATDGYYVSANGTPYVQINVVQSTGVSSFAGRSGAVVPKLGDYSFSLLSGVLTVAQMPAIFTCAQVGTQTGSGNTITLSGCK